MFSTFRWQWIGTATTLLIIGVVYVNASGFAKLKIGTKSALLPKSTRSQLAYPQSDKEISARTKSSKITSSEASSSDFENSNIYSSSLSPLEWSSTDCERYCLKFIAEALYWRALEDGFDCCNGCGVKNYDWNWGYRLGLWYRPTFSTCKGALVLSHYHHDAHRKCSDGCNGVWKLHYRTLDFLLNKEICMNSCLFWTPFCGIRAAWIRQKVFSQVIKESTSPTDPFILTRVREDHSKLNGAGPLIGFGGQCKLNCCFSLYGTLSMGLLYGNFHLKSFGSDTFTDPDQTFTCSENRNLQISQLFADAAFGIQCEKCVCRNLRLIFQVGVEHHRYFGFNRNGCLGDLCFDGVNLSLGFRL